MVGQKSNKLDFGSIMDEGRILLAKLSQGLIGESNCYLLGSLLVSKFHQLTIGRQHQDLEDRKPFYLYLDEFHHFVTPSLATILTGARKYRMGLTLAHHSLNQLQRENEVGSAILSNSYSRICFRVSDDDARKLSEGFECFEPSDIQNLGTGEAIGRVERKEFDFNLQTILPPELDEDAPLRAKYLKYISRSKYGTPRQKVEEELANSRFKAKRERVDPFAKRTSQKSEKQKPPPSTEPTQKTEAARSTSNEEDYNITPVPMVPVPIKEPPPPRTKPRGSKPTFTPPGKGGNVHVEFQRKVRLIAQQRGWTSHLEERLGQFGDVDVMLRKGNFQVACEVSVTTPESFEVQSIRKRLLGGAHFVVVLGPDTKHVLKIETLAKSEFGSQVGTQIHFRCMENLGEFLDVIDARSKCTEEIIGEAKVKFEVKPTSEERKKKAQKTKLEAMKKLFRGARGMGGPAQS
jgi:hypothetical protein